MAGGGRPYPASSARRRRADQTDNGEYRYYAPNGNTFCAPVMLGHHVGAHGYRPPAEILADIADPLVGVDVGSGG